MIRACKCESCGAYVYESANVCSHCLLQLVRLNELAVRIYRRFKPAYGFTYETILWCINHLQEKLRKQ